MSRAVEFMRQAAEALDYAHSQGVIHRDIKPGNLMIDDQGHLWITDFGLAKTNQTDDLTRTGCVVGTLRFLAPERFRGEVSPAGDIYSLGATLYELLTLRAALDDPNRERLIERILKEEPARPRQLNPRIPRDLETIIQRCMAKEPAQRYGKAGDLAEDLTRFMRGEPIHARRIGIVERLSRWAKRNPMIAGLTTAVFLSLAVGLGFSVFFGWKAELSRREAEKNLGLFRGEYERAESQRDEADRNLADAMQAVEDFLVRIGESQLIDVPGLHPVRQELLEQAAKYYQGFLARRNDDPRIAAETAKVEYRLARTKQFLGDSASAVQLYRQAIDRFRALSAREPSADAFAWTARCLIFLARIEYHAGRNDAAEKMCLDALDQVDRALVLDPTSFIARGQQTLALAELSILDRARLRFTDAIARMKQAVAVADELTREYNNSPVLVMERASHQSALGQNYCEARIFDQARIALNAARKDILGLVDHKGLNFRARSELAFIARYLGTTEKLAGQFKKAEPWLLESRTLYQDLARENPQVSTYRIDVAAVEAELARLYVDLNRLDDALTSARATLAMYEETSRKNSDNVILKGRIATSHNMLGVVQRRRNELDAAEASFRKAKDLYSDLMVVRPNDLSTRHLLAGSWWNIGNVLQQQKRIDDAVPCFREAYKHDRAVFAQTPDWPSVRDQLSKSYNQLTLLLYQQSEFAEVVSLLDEWISWETDPDRLIEIAARYAQIAHYGGVPTELQSRCQVATIPAIRKTVEAGYRKLDSLKKPFFDPFRDEPEFQELQSKMAGPPPAKTPSK